MVKTLALSAGKIMRISPRSLAVATTPYHRRYFPQDSSPPIMVAADILPFVQGYYLRASRD